MTIRSVAKTVTGIKTWDGAGVKLTRVLGHPDVKDFDPFLMLDAFDSGNPDDYTKGFPWHPHRGIETVTYLIAGKINHEDSLGNVGAITDGSCQWMTAGCGILHQEMPQSSALMLGTQLWINLPREDKMTPPAYNDIRGESVVKVEEDGARVAVISGEYKGRRAPMQGNFVKTCYLDVALASGRTWNNGTPGENTAFLYVISGTIVIDGHEYAGKQAILLTHGESVSLAAGAGGARFLFFSAKPLHEPVAWGGPIVMNTREELRRAFEEIDNGSFVKGCEKANMSFYK